MRTYTCTMGLHRVSASSKDERPEALARMRSRSSTNAPKLAGLSPPPKRRPRSMALLHAEDYTLPAGPGAALCAGPQAFQSFYTSTRGILCRRFPQRGARTYEMAPRAPSTFPSGQAKRSKLDPHHFFQLQRDLFCMSRESWRGREWG